MLDVKPYYERSGVTIYCGDCRELLPQLPPVDLVCTDPPYGLGDRWQGGTWGSAPEYRDARRWDVRADESFLLEIVGKGRSAILWGGNYYALPPCRGILAWVKSNAVPTMADLEIAWTTFDRPAKAWHSGVNPDGKHLHPTQKPLHLMRWSIMQAGDDIDLILDPFCGSGTTLRAAKDLGRKAIGIDVHEPYCEIAARRLDQEVLQFTD